MSSSRMLCIFIYLKGAFCCRRRRSSLILSSRSSCARLTPIKERQLCLRRGAFLSTDILTASDSTAAPGAAVIPDCKEFSWIKSEM